MRRQLLLLAPAGMLIGHAVGYLMAPSTEHHAAVAAAHGHVPAVVALAAPLAIAGLVLGALHHRRPSHRGGLLSLSVLQVTTYCGMEVVERVAAGLDAVGAVSDPMVLAGLGAQLVVAAVLLAVHRGARRAGRFIAEALRRPRLLPANDGARLAFPATSYVPVCRAGWRAWQRRGPPPLLLTR